MSRRQRLLLWGAVALGPLNALAFLALALAAIWSGDQRFEHTAWLWFFVAVVAAIGACVAGDALHDDANNGQPPR